jgi:branched-chain amino acid transport system substrate-binding protein
MPRTTRLAAVFALAVFALAAVGCGSDSDDSADGDAFRIGLEAPLSGELSVLGEGMLEGAELAANQLNDGDGILGRQVEIVPIDDAGDAETGVEAAEEAIEDGLDGIVGPYNSGVGIETLPLYVDAGLVPIRLTSDTATNGLGFTLQPMTYQIAPVASEALTEWLDAERVAIAYDPTQNYTVSVSEALKDSLEEAGVTVTAYERVQPGRDSYANLIERLAGDDPDVIYAAVYYPEGGLIAKEMHEGDVQASCLADYGSYDTGFVEVAGEDAARACPVVGVPAPGDFPGAGQRVADFRAEFDRAPGTWSPYTYDSVNFLADGIEKAGGTEAETLTDALNDLGDWSGWTGSVEIDPQNGNRRPATVVIVGTDADGQLRVDREWAKAVGAPY